MPTYEYKCENCDHHFENFQTMTSKPLRKCPECGKNKLIRLIGSGAGIIFKGTGFYQTDYRSENYKKAASSDNKAPSTTEKKDIATKDSKKESKPAEKTTTPKTDKKASSK